MTLMMTSNNIKLDSVETIKRENHLGIEGLLDADSSLNLGFTSLNLSHQTFNVLQLTAAFPEHTRVLHHLRHSNANDIIY